ncbi:MAG: T9SS C-terminal target domain-containing protein, partial [Candidatus Zixiibacteriota bacterium]
SDTVTTTPGDFFADAYFELTNCGDTATMVSLALSIDVLGPEPLATIPVRVGAGETVSRHFQFPVPPAVPPGDYAITITATAGDAMVSKTEVVTVLAGNLGGGVAANTLTAVNHPNPFNPSTQISFNLPQAGSVNLTIYNMLGQKVRTLIADDFLSAGEHTVTWDGSNADGRHVASGIYLYRLTTEAETLTRKMLLAK